jgi:ssDNA-binding Zn-finger/Zn-ribbon topoisomerase 1
MKTMNFHSLRGPLKMAWQKCVLAGAREIEQMRARSGPRCPHCGGQLILRRVGFGRDAGKQFWDCSNVGRCSVSLAADNVAWPEASPFAATAAAAP